MTNTLQNKKIYLLALVALLAYAGLGALFYQNQALSKKIENSRKIYVYDLQEVLKSLNIVEIKQKYEQDLVALNQDLLAAEKKIKSFKDAKLKEDFSEMYFKNLRLKRDELVQNYEKSVKELTDKINVALAEIANEKGAPSIFVRDVIAVKTPYIVDLTDEVIKHIKE